MNSLLKYLNVKPLICLLKIHKWKYTYGKNEHKRLDKSSLGQSGKINNMNKEQEKTLDNLKYWFQTFYDSSGYHNYSKNIEFILNDKTRLNLKGYYNFVNNYWLIFDSDMKIYSDKEIKYIKIITSTNKTLIINR